MQSLFYHALNSKAVHIKILEEIDAAHAKIGEAILL